MQTDAIATSINTSKEYEAVSSSFISEQVKKFGKLKKLSSFNYSETSNYGDTHGGRKRIPSIGEILGWAGVC